MLPGVSHPTADSDRNSSQAKELPWDAPRELVPNSDRNCSQAKELPWDAPRGLLPNSDRNCCQGSWSNQAPSFLACQSFLSLP